MVTERPGCRGPNGGTHKGGGKDNMQEHLRLQRDVLRMAVLPWAEAHVQARGPGPGQVVGQGQHGLHFELVLGILRRGRASDGSGLWDGVTLTALAGGVLHTVRVLMYPAHILSPPHPPKERCYCSATVTLDPLHKKVQN